MDLSGDSLLLDFTFTVSYEARLTESTWAAPLQAIDVWSPDVDLVFLGGEEELHRQEASFQIPSASLGNSLTPQRGDRFTTPDARVWIVEEVELDTRIAAFRLVAYYLEPTGSL